jgi:hypothetical protein
LIQSTKTQLDPGPILQTAFAFWSSKVLLTAVEFELFTKLGTRRMTGEELGAELGLHSRGNSDFFDALVAMQFLDRAGDGPSAQYFNTPAGALYLDRGSPRYVGGWLAMLNDRLFKFWHDLPAALRTGKQQNEAKHRDNVEAVHNVVFGRVEVTVGSVDNAGLRQSGSAFGVKIFDDEFLAKNGVGNKQQD